MMHPAGLLGFTMLFFRCALPDNAIGPVSNEVLSVGFWPPYVPTELGHKCAHNVDCSHTRFAHCHHGICSCYPYHVRYNATLCLPATLLGYGCLTSKQCQMKVPSSRCENGVCVCQRGYVQYRKDSCLVGARVGQFCASDDQCQLSSQGSYCQYVIPRLYGWCACFPGFSANKGQQCVLSSSEVPVSLGKSCQNSAQCQARDPNSHCVDGTCQCIQSNSQCGVHNTGCHKDTFQCRDGDCISWYFVCDGRRNCRDGTDEEDCVRGRCPKEAFQCKKSDNCISRGKLCNGKQDCWDGSDEHHCYRDCNTTRTFPCTDGPCLPQYMFCNAVSSCKDQSDEDPQTCELGHHCPPEHFRCKNGRCRSTAVLCSGKDGCGDNSDEAHCKVCYCPKPN